MRPQFKNDPASPASKALLNHEQRHFDISEVYTRVVRKQMLDILNNKLVHEISCGAWAECKQEVQSLDNRLRDAKTKGKSAWQTEQDQYDQETNHGQNVTAQAAWNAKIDGWLADPSSAPLSD
jgi:hypothetical protein